MPCWVTVFLELGNSDDGGFSIHVEFLREFRMRSVSLCYAYCNC